MALSDKLRWYEPVIQSKYPHMPLFHRVLWDIYLNCHPPDLMRIAYDVCVGAGREVPPVTNTDLINDWKYLTSFKIDALAELIDGYKIFEIKTQANPESVGQCLIYKSLLSTMVQRGTRIEVAIICDTSHPDMLKACKDYGIEIYECNFLVNRS